MSEFIAEAVVRIRPDTTRFRAQLQEEISRAISQVSAIVPVQFVASGGGVVSSTAALAAAQTQLAQTTQTVTGLAQVENTTFARQAVILEGASAATLQKAGADETAAGAARTHAVAQGQVGKAAIASTAGMLGLRGAVLTAGSAFIAATVGFQAFGKAIQSTIDFERELAVFQVTAGASADEMERVGEAARSLGRDITLPGVSAGDAAAALTELSKAGLSVQQAIDAARGTLQLATAAEIDNASAAQLVANSLNAFQLAGGEATRVADLLAGAANASQGSITDMGLALKQASAAARIVGLDASETVTLLTELSRAGLSASDAGTSLRTTLLRLVGDFPKVAAEIDRLNLQLRDVNGNIRPEFFSELGDRLARITPKARQFTTALLGGSDALRAIGILSRSSTEDFRNLEAQISRTGIAQEVASAQTEGLGGDVEAAKNQFADLGLTIGQVASGPLSLLVRTAGQAAGAINDVNREVSESSGGQGFFAAFGDVINDFANSFARLNLNFREGVRTAQAVTDRFTILDAATVRVTDSVNALAEALRNASRETLSKQGLPAEGLNVQQILNRVTGFDTQETGARIHQDNEELLSVLESERSFLEDQLQRRFVKRRPELFRQLRQALLGVTNDILAIQKEGAAAAKKAAADAKRARDEADRALLELLSDRREDAQRKIATAATTQGIADDLRAQDRLQALIQAQIKKIRARVRNEQERRRAIRELRIALIQSRQEEERLREEQKQQAKEQAQQILDLRIQTAEIRGQVRLEERLLNIKIKQLKARIEAAKGDRLLQAQLRLELAQTQKELEDLKKQKKDTDRAFKEATFAFLQTQAGFAANLLGNLIPGFATSGLVGGTTGGGRGGPAEIGAAPQDRVSQAAALTAARDRNVRPVQVDTTNQLLRQILRVLQNTNGRLGHPEARNQRAASNAALDTVH